MQEELENIRGKHDAQNQNLEANLDVVLDRLRQGPIHEVSPRRRDIIITTQKYI